MQLRYAQSQTLGAHSLARVPIRVVGDTTQFNVDQPRIFRVLQSNVCILHRPMTHIELTQPERRSANIFSNTILCRKLNYINSTITIAKTSTDCFHPIAQTKIKPCIFVSLFRWSFLLYFSLLLIYDD